MLASAVAVAAPLRAQELAGIELQWNGSPSCPEAGDVLLLVRGMVDPEWQSQHTVSVRVELRDLERGAIQVSFQADHGQGSVLRTFAVMSCAEARKAAAVWISLSTSADDESATAASGVAATATPPAPIATAAEPRTPEAAKAVVKQEPDNEVPPPPVERREPMPPFAPRAGVTVALAAGVEAPVLAGASALFGGWIGWRSKHAEVDLGGHVWLPAQHVVENVQIRIEQAGAVLGGCYWLSFGRWEIAPSLKLFVERVSAEIEGTDAGSSAWTRLAPGARFGVWLGSHVTLQLSVDALISLNRPKFSMPDGSSVQTTPFDAAALLAIGWAP